MIRLTGSDGEHAVLHDMGGSGAPLLLTHGNSLNAGMWATVVPHLQDGFRCWGLDFRGHGAARPQHDDMSVERSRFVDEVLAAAGPLGGEPLLAAGHSLGGSSLLLAELAQPGSYTGLWLYEPLLAPPGSPRPEADHPLVQASRRRRIHFESLDEAYERFVSKPPFSGCEPEAVRAYLELGTYPTDDGAVRLSCSGDTEARIYVTGLSIEYTRLGTIRCPAVVARGGSGAMRNDIPPKLAQPIAEALGDGRLEVFSEFGHFGPMQDGAAIARSIRSHLEPLVAA
ncbi:alpha/beta fold hydrolase [Candidatus Poriferisodalis sp.]|uniref:alpha/beta fold hydrolase n=1 Tax=Candidatus Poriferisodalis sp. TaxID=3101277 RepID=UPI003C7055BD